jgi:hypothetical protein
MRTTPTITGCLTVDVSQHVEPYGIIGGKAGMAAWRVLSAAPPGISIRLNIGAGKVALDSFWRIIDEGNILDATDITVEGTEPEGVESILSILRTVRDHRAQRYAA